VLLDQHGLGHELVKRLRFDGYDVVTAVAGVRFEKVGENTYIVCPDSENDFSEPRSCHFMLTRSNRLGDVALPQGPPHLTG
jgi:hypothetical protein